MSNMFDDDFDVDAVDNFDISKIDQMVEELGLSDGDVFEGLGDEPKHGLNIKNIVDIDKSWER